MNQKPPVPGQRWVSDTEPELGLGILLKAGFGRVEVFFPAAGEQRQYALKSAPLRRVQFKEGDRIKLHSGEGVVVAAVEDRKGLLVYRAGEREIAEAELCDTISFSKPEERLFAGQVDDLRTFDLRAKALHRRSEYAKSPVRGFIGARADLIPHQLYIAREAASRLVPRVLLADEVGLGKTIEAGLILHRLHLTGRAGRVLILVPEPLIHQWFVELLRRFNLLFSLFDEERCEAIEEHHPGTNPFLDSQLVIASVSYLAGNAQRAQQVVDAGWDLLVVDEAHHLAWRPDGPGAEYTLVESLAAKTPGLLLLTATPQQLGPEGHFARLRLLDPDRYRDLAQFLAEAGHYEHAARAIDRVLSGKPLSGADRTFFAQRSERILRHSEYLAGGNEAARGALVAALLDEFGIGRVMFRNTRAALSGFPERRANLVPLDAAADEMTAKIRWLVALLKKLTTGKLLLICRTRELAETIHTRLLREINVNAALFHEELTLLQRDRNAAYFAEEYGARILICSEIGSEGRNFQFAHHLALFDLPDDPELLEQRIGRLDRIGQSATIQIHVPYVRGSGSEVLARWYHEALNAFEKHPHAAPELARELAAELAALRENFDAEALGAFIAKAREQNAALAKKLERGHDRLLELNSCRVEPAAETIAQIRSQDDDASFEEFCIEMFDFFGVHVEELAPRSYLLRAGHLRTDAFPALPEAGLSATFDRARALAREDLAFLSWDHPVVRGALDLLLGGESGNAAFAVWKNGSRESVLLEIFAVVECIAPPALHADRFLPATPIRIVVDHALNDLSDDAEAAAAKLEAGDIFRLLDRGAVKKKLLPAMIEKALAFATERRDALVAAASARMDARLREEIERLEDLRKINDHVRPEEIAAARNQQEALREALAASPLRLDALRLILQMG